MLSPEEFLLGYTMATGHLIGHNIHKHCSEKLQYWYTAYFTEEQKYIVFIEQILKYTKASEYVSSEFYSKTENHIAEVHSSRP